MQVTESEAVERLMSSGLREREKRTIMRDLEKGDISPADIVAALEGKLNPEDGGMSWVRVMASASARECVWRDGARCSRKC